MVRLRIRFMKWYNQISVKAALRITMMYFFLGSIWILLSERILMTVFAEDLAMYQFIQPYKGWFYVTITAIILYGLVYRKFVRILQSETELKDKEIMLKKSEQNYRSLVDHNPEGIYSLDSNGCLMSVNQAGERITGFSANDLVGMHFTELVIPSERKQNFINFNKVLNGVPQKYETKINRKDNSISIIESTLVPSILNGKIIGVFGIWQDVTNEREQEERYMKSEKLSIIGELAAGVAHEIRNPLTALKGFVQMMDESNKVNRDYLTIMSSEIDRIHLIVSELLLLGKHQVIQLQKMDVKELLNQTITLMNTQGIINDVMITFNHTYKEPIFIYCEGNQIKQIFINIIKNAIEAMPDGGALHIGVVVLDNKEVLISFKDHGKGIPKERLAQIGEPFYSTKESGTGLGLMVSFKIIERHKGKIDIESSEGMGTIVKVRLPLYKSNELKET
jgi:PAS domain S-box-containing protein